MSQDSSPQQVAHMVYFTLKESNNESRKALVESCEKYLTDHPGVVYCSFGVRGDDFTRPVNDQEFDVALNVVFESRDAHDQYQESSRHLDFIATNKPTWAKVRVFDSYL